MRLLLGGYCVRTEGSKIKEQRQNLDLSIGKLAEIIEVSKEALYAYERNSTRPSTSIAYKLEEMLGVPIVKAIDLFKKSRKFKGQKNNRVLRFKGRVPRSVLSILNALGLKITQLNRTPFDFIANYPQGKAKILGGIFEKNETLLKKIVKKLSV